MIDVIEGLKLWIKDIAFYVIFISLISIIMPHKKYRKYINIILGLIFMLVVIKPLAKINNIDDKLFMDMFNRQANIEMNSIQNSNGYMTENQLKIIKATYKDNLKLQVKNLLANQSVEVVDIDISIVESRENNRFGAINKISLKVYKESIDDKKSDDVDIKPIRIKNINIKADKDDNEADKIIDQESILLKKRLSNIVGNFYNLSEEKISVTVIKSRGDEQ